MKQPIRYVLFGLLYLLLPLALLAVLYVVDRPFNVSEDYRVRATHWSRSFSDIPPESGWRSIEEGYPDARRDGEPFTSVWYRFEVASAMSNSALLIAYGHGNFDVWRAGRRVAQTAPATQPLHYNRSTVLVPLGDVVVGENIAIRVTRQAAGIRAGYLYIAPIADAQRDAAEQAVLQQNVPQTILTVMLSFAVVVGAMFIMRPRERYYGWYALTLFIWAGHTVHNLTESIPFSHFWFFSLNHLLLNWLLTELFFINRYFAIPAPKLEKICTVVCLGLSIGHIAIASQAGTSLAFESQFFLNYVVLEAWYFVLAIIVSSRYFVALKHQWSFDSVSLWLASGIVIVVGLRDIFYATGFVKVPGSVFYLQFVATIPLLIFGVQLMRRFARDATTAEMRNAQLNQLVEERTLALETTYQKLSDEERRRALAEERSRLMRDMHDGLGGQLVHALALSEQVDDEDLQRSLRLALDDLRLIVDSLSPSANSFHDLMASYRHRVSRLLQRTGFSVEWNISEQAEAIALKPNEALSVLRIVQEAVTNAVRHSGGTALRIEVHCALDRIRIAVSDNGNGIPDSIVERGLRNMKVRASELGAQLDIQSEPGHTTVGLNLPMNR
ncbi:MAG: ATP-binding protein [Pseudomonadota bacterium]